MTLMNKKTPLMTEFFIGGFFKIRRSLDSDVKLNQPKFSTIIV